MTVPRSSAILASLLALACLPAAGLAEQAPPVPPASRPRSMFQIAVPHPTGKNGYEELVLAAELVRSSEVWKRVELLGAEATLAQKREALVDPPVVKAMGLIRQGLAKPVSQPRTEMGPETLLPEMAGFRSIARLLAVQQYVYLADGRTADAIANVRTCLRIGKVVQTDTLISGLVGIAIGAITAKTLGAHLDQLNARDCEALYQVCQEWLSQPETLGSLLQAERQFGRKALGDLRNRSESLKEYIGVTSDPSMDTDEDRRSRQLVADVQTLQAAHPEAYGRLIDQALTELDRTWDRQLQELKKPPWQREPAKVDESTLGGRLAGAVFPTSVPVLERFSSEQATIRLLAVHAVIRRYRWERGKLPADLAALSIGDLALDPFTGRPLLYEPQGTRYRLTSVGATASMDDPLAVDGRRPISVTPDN
jgi:hypothetical protein